MKSLVLTSSAIALLIGVACRQATAGEAKAYAVPKDGLKIDGRVNQDDPVVKIVFGLGLTHDLAAKSYDVKLTAGKTYRIAMNSSAIDSVIAVHDKSGKQLAYDDDSGGDLNSLLSFTPPKDDIYRIYTASLKNAGSFTLLIGEQSSILNVKGQIDLTDLKVKVIFDANNSKELPAKPYEVSLSAGKTYRAVMTGKQLDALLVVHDKTGQQLAIDNGLAFPDAVMMFSPPRSDTYKFYAVAEKGTGDFNLLVTEENSIATVREVNSGLRIDGRLDQVLKTITYQVKLVEGKTYVFDMARSAGDLQFNKVDPILYLKNPAGTRMSQVDSFGNVHARMVYRVPATDVYQLEATSYQQKGIGKFTLSIREKSPEIFGTFQDGVYQAQGMLAKEDPRDELLAKSPQKVYNLRLTAKKRYVIDLKSKEFDAFLRLEDSMGNQVALDDDGGVGSNARIFFDASNTGTYHIIVTNLDEKTGAYTLTAREK